MSLSADVLLVMVANSTIHSLENIKGEVMDSSLVLRIGIHLVAIPFEAVLVNQATVDPVAQLVMAIL
jgi:hypothetical protein